VAKKKPRTCKACGKPEKRSVGGLYTSIAPLLGICADCINSLPKGEEYIKSLQK
jgi:hypothetical protein